MNVASQPQVTSDHSNLVAQVNNRLYNLDPKAFVECHNILLFWLILYTVFMHSYGNWKQPTLQLFSPLFSSAKKQNQDYWSE